MNRASLPTRRWRMLLGYALAVALVHQLGACPCGCLDGNLWLQTYQRWAEGDATPLAAAVLVNAAGEPRAESSECDEDEASVVYVASSDSHASSLPGAVDVALGALVHGRGFGFRAGLSTLDDFTGRARPPGVSARTLRAQFQIFLI